jgi:hypothetical protein
MGMAEIVTRFQENRRRHGVGAALYDMECVVLDRVVHLQVLRAMVVELGDVTDPRLFEAPGFTGRFVEPGELEELARAGAHELDPPFLAQAARRGDRCHAIFAGSELAAYGWYARQPTPIDERFTLHFDPSYAYMFKGYTAPAHRGKRLHAFGMCQALRTLTEEGARGLVSYIACNNFASLKSAARMGYRIFGDIYLLHAAGRPFARVSAGCRPYGFHVEPRSS